MTCTGIFEMGQKCVKRGRMTCVLILLPSALFQVFNT
jgi:hypothetical protein